MENRICLNSNTYHGFSLDEALEGSARAGFSYIELCAVRGYTEHVRFEMTEAEINEVKEKLRAHKLECIALGAHSNIVSDEGFDNFKKSIELAGKLGCQFIVTSTGDAHDDHDVIEDEMALVKVLQELMEECSKYNVTLVIETHGNNYATGDTVKSLVEKVDSPLIGVNYDTANVIFYGNTLPYEDLEQSATAVKLIHLKDKLGEDHEWNFPAIGKGNLDFTKVFKILEETNCTAPISVEVEFTQKGPANLEEVDQAVFDSYQAIQRLLASKQ
jgi:L-ribulose-5-phosphate 3-epimerase